MRLVNLKDTDWILNLMNQPSVRKASVISVFNGTHLITKKENEKYWKKILKQKDFQAYSINKLGLIKINKGNIGIVIDEKHRRKGLAYNNLKKLIKKGYKAEIRTNNKASIKLFKKLGFKEKVRIYTYDI